MIIKAVSLFLIFMVVLAMFGKLRAPKVISKMRRKTITPGGKCTRCGTPIVGKGPCPCGKRT